MSRFLISWLMAVLLLCGCAAMPGVQLLPSRATHVPVTVFYGTDRAAQGSADDEGHFGSERGPLSLGQVTVWLPREASHDALLAVDDDLNGLEGLPAHPVLSGLEAMDAEVFEQALEAAIDASPEKSVLFFTHGFKRSFSEAAVAVAQLSRRTGYRGVAVLWSWPSLDKATGYVGDTTNLSWSEPHLHEFLLRLINDTRADRVDLVAHSMGARGLLLALLHDAVDIVPFDWSRLGELVLLAPDIDTGLFHRDIVPQIHRHAISTTLYVSENDRALIASRHLHAHPRVGDAGGGIVIAPGIETIDVTSRNFSILGHSYYRESEAVIADLRQLLVARRRAAQRDTIEPVETAAGVYWQPRTEKTSPIPPGP